MLKEVSFFLILLVAVSFNSVSANTLFSSVSPEFPNGLHVKYLQFIASKMNMELDIVPMPFARRVVALQSGQIDLMVGMQREKDTQDDIIYIYPGYEQLRHTFFVLASNQTELTNFDDLLQLNIGVTIHAKYYQHFQQQEGLHLIAVSTLKQKIELLLKGRIDTFIHYQQSTEPLLKQMQLENRVVIAPYQPTEYNEYYVTISLKSRLYPYQETLQKVIKEAVDNHDFIRIREKHYLH
ncbi:ABC transporter substrate-binding protein [Paraglaciecola sp.]|uniref:substrate-binding periplasmic protein n=1 Tax=Paraglaciecola sp. TaxID=1920173 RepID=UPI0030F3E423